MIIGFEGALLLYRSQFIAEAVFSGLLCLNVILQFFMAFEQKTDIHIEREDVEDPEIENMKSTQVTDLKTRKTPKKKKPKAVKKISSFQKV